MAKSGRCHICGETRKLTEEHIPPYSAMNDSPVCLYHGEQALSTDQMPWESEGRTGRPLKDGVHFKRLCGHCNSSLTGIHYVPAFSTFAKQAYAMLQRNGPFPSSALITLQFKDLYPLRIAKQVVAMFLGINPPELGDLEPELRAFVMRREQRGLSPSEYGLYAYIAGGELCRYCGLGVLMTGFDTGSPKPTRAVSELASVPFGFMLELDPEKKQEGLTDILDFANKYDIDEARDIRLELPIKEINSVIPLDYRSQKEVAVDYIASLLNQAQKPFPM